MRCSGANPPKTVRDSREISGHSRERLKGATDGEATCQESRTTGEALVTDFSPISAVVVKVVSGATVQVDGSARREVAFPLRSMPSSTGVRSGNYAPARGSRAIA